MQEAIEVIARGVLFGTRGILLCRQVGGEFTFLPGGHVLLGETASATLAREVKEALGMRIEVGEFYGVVENVFSVGETNHHEINLVFTMHSPAVERRVKFSPLEPQVEFLWQPINMLAEAQLLPKALRQLIPLWSRGKRITWTSHNHE